MYISRTMARTIAWGVHVAAEWCLSLRTQWGNVKLLVANARDAIGSQLKYQWVSHIVWNSSSGWLHNEEELSVDPISTCENLRYAGISPLKSSLNLALTWIL